LFREDLKDTKELFHGVVDNCEIDAQCEPKVEARLSKDPRESNSSAERKHILEEVEKHLLSPEPNPQRTAENNNISEKSDEYKP